jgi:hypothetical protein
VQSKNDSDCALSSLIRTVEYRNGEARDDADSIVAALLSQLVERRGQSAMSIPIGATSEMLSQVKDANPRMVSISALPPFALNHARDLYARLRASSPQLHVIVCLWHSDAEPKATAIRLKLAPGHGFFATLQQALHHISFRSQWPAEVENQG